MMRTNELRGRFGRMSRSAWSRDRGGAGCCLPVVARLLVLGQPILRSPGGTGGLRRSAEAGSTLLEPQERATPAGHPNRPGAIDGAARVACMSRTERFDARSLEK